MKDVKVEYVNLDENSEDDKFDEMIKKQEEREMEMKKVYNDYLDEMGALGEKAEQYEDERLEALSISAKTLEEEMIDDMLPRKGITVRLLPDAHKVLKLIATSKDTTLEKIATSIVEDLIERVDIIQYVSDEFKDEAFIRFNQEDRYDTTKIYYDTAVAKKLINGKSRKRINVKVDYLTHRKLRVIAATQDRTLDNLVSELIENEIGVTIDREELLNEVKANKSNSE